MFTYRRENEPAEVCKSNKNVCLSLLQTYITGQKNISDSKEHSHSSHAVLEKQAVDLHCHQEILVLNHHAGLKLTFIISLLNCFAAHIM